MAFLHIYIFFGPRDRYEREHAINRVLICVRSSGGIREFDEGRSIAHK